MVFVFIAVIKRGEGCKAVISHEVGHIITNNNPSLYLRTLNTLKRKAANEKEHVRCYIVKNISVYAGEINKKGYPELLPEINTELTFGKKRGIINLLRKEALYNET